MSNLVNPWPTAKYNASNPFNPYNLPDSQLTPAQKQWTMLGSAGQTYLYLVPGAYVPPTTNTPINTHTDDQSAGQVSPNNSDGSHNQNISQATIPNILKDYASYTALTSFQVTTPDKYNKMVNSNFYEAADWYTICQSGGIGPVKAISPYNGKTFFSKDMYIDDVIINTITGLNHENKGSNAVDIEFTVVEPLGMDFIEQLYDFCTFGLLQENYLDLTYLLKISFKGYKVDGTYETVPGATKYIPIKLVTMDVKLNVMGSTYKVSAIAYNEVAGSEQFGRVVSMIEMAQDEILLKADYITKVQGTDLSNANSSANWQPAYGAVKTFTTQGTATTLNLDNGNVSYVINSFMQCLNNQQLYMAQVNTGYIADQYGVVFVDRSAAFPWDLNGFEQNYQRKNIGAFPFDPPEVPSQNQAPSGQHLPMATATTTDHFDVIEAAKNIKKNSSINSSGGTSSGITYSSNNGYKITIAAGSSIIDCITTFIANSGFTIQQFRAYNNKLSDINDKLLTLYKSPGFVIGANIPDDIQAEISGLQQSPLNWFMVKPQVQLLGYDSARKTFAKKITYYIKPYDIFNCLSFLAPNSDPTNHGRVVKEYDYMFTGKNTEILNFDIEFNTAFLVYSQFNNSTKGQGTGAVQPDKKLITPNAIQTVPSVSNSGISQVMVSASSYDTKGTGLTDPERNQSADVQATIYSTGDQIQLNLAIYGDPDYIIQDGLFLTFSSAPDTCFVIGNEPDNTQIKGIIYDYGEVYANINFKVPQDVNLDTGTLDLSFSDNSTEYKRNIFSGQYRVLKVENKIDKGLFTQKLELIRYVDTHNFSTTGYATDKLNSIATADAKEQVQNASIIASSEAVSKVSNQNYIDNSNQIFNSLKK